MLNLGYKYFLYIENFTYRKLDFLKLIELNGNKIKFIFFSMLFTVEHLKKWPLLPRGIQMPQSHLSFLATQSPSLLFNSLPSHERAIREAPLIKF
jgi:hypothetical protein